jgi:hypothetical protein
MPALYRTVNQNVNIPGKRPLFIGGVVCAALLFIGVTWALADAIGVYAAPVGMFVGFALPASFLFIKGQRGNKPLRFPYRQVLTALLLAAALAGVAELLPDASPIVELAIALVLIALWIVLLVPLRAIPRAHWTPLLHMLRSFRRGTPANFRPRRGLRGLEQAERDELRAAVAGRVPRERLQPVEAGEGERLVRELRKVGRRGGIPLAKRTRHDAGLAMVLFEPASTAVRNAAGRGAMAAGADPNDLRALEDLVSHLSKVPDDAWYGTPAKETRSARRAARLRRGFSRSRRLRGRPRSSSA